MNLSYLFQLFLDQFSPFASSLAISSFVYVMLGRSKSFHFQRIPRLILAAIIGLYSANSLDFSRIIGIAATATTFGLVGILVWHVALQRGKTLQQSVNTGSPTGSKIQEDLLKKLLEMVSKR